jgi:hypothetical protein
MESYFNKDFPEFLLRSFNFLELLDDLELILKSSEHFMLGPWLESAKALGTTEEEKALLEYNARIQVVDNLFSNNENSPIYILRALSSFKFGSNRFSYSNVDKADRYECIHLLRIVNK